MEKVPNTFPNQKHLESLLIHPIKFLFIIIHNISHIGEKKNPTHFDVVD
jgi:hypothetical protein